ncbi:hypothetical protein D3C71_1025950 [compost metagenome]
MGCLRRADGRGQLIGHPMLQPALRGGPGHAQGLHQQATARPQQGRRMLAGAGSLQHTRALRLPGQQTLQAVQPCLRRSPLQQQRLQLPLQLQARGVPVRAGLQLMTQQAVQGIGVAAWVGRRGGRRPQVVPGRVAYLRGPFACPMPDAHILGHAQVLLAGLLVYRIAQQRAEVQVVAVAVLRRVCRAGIALARQCQQRGLQLLAKRRHALLQAAPTHAVQVALLPTRVHVPVRAQVVAAGMEIRAGRGRQQGAQAPVLAWQPGLQLLQRGGGPGRRRVLPGQRHAGQLHQPRAAFVCVRPVHQGQCACHRRGIQGRAHVHQRQPRIQIGQGVHIAGDQQLRRVPGRTGPPGTRAQQCAVHRPVPGEGALVTAHGRGILHQQ